MSFLVRALPAARTISARTVAPRIAPFAMSRALHAAAQAKPGDAVPSVPIRVDAMDNKVDFSKLKGKNVIVTVPGAFTPTCSSQVPGFIADADKFAAKGVDAIYVVAVNDLFVMNAWKKDMNAPDKVKFAADDQAELAHALGTVLDATPALGNLRFKRCVFVIQDGKLVDVTVEPESGKSTVTAADKILSKL